MHVTQLPFPGRVTNSLQLRREVVRTISSMQVSRRPGGTHPAADDVKAFLQAAITFIDGMVIAAPTVTTAPALSGTAKVGQTLTVSAGAFTAGSTVTRQWTANNVVIPGAVGLTYVPKVADIGKVIRVVTKATNAGGSVNSTTAPSSAVIA